MRRIFGITKKESTPTTNLNWTNLTDSNVLSKIKQNSTNKPILIFKHSTSCPTSGMALNRLERNWDGNTVDQMETYYLDLLSYRNISNQIAEDFNVIHQSPQVLIISKGNAIYNESHLGISFDSIKEIVKEVIPLE